MTNLSIKLIIISFILELIIPWIEAQQIHNNDNGFSSTNSKRKENKKYNDLSFSSSIIHNNNISNNSVERRENYAIDTYENTPIKYLSDEEKKKLKEEMEDTAFISAKIDNADGNFYNQLDYNGKKVYDAIYEGSKKSLPDFTILVDLKGDLNYTYFINVELPTISQHAFTTLIYENPELWWIGNISAGCRNGTSYDSENKRDYHVTYYIVPNASVIYNYTNEVMDILNQRIIKVTDEIKAEISKLNLTTEYAILRYINEYLVRKITYVLDENRRHIRNLYGALVENECVCECYAEAFQHLARQYGINCIITRSADHEWNFVQMKDNKNWYVVDVTWNENNYNNNQTSTLNYFLIGDNTQIPGDSKVYNNETHHQLVYSAFPGDIFVKYPTLSSEKYTTSETIDISTFQQSIDSIISKSKYY